MGKHLAVGRLLDDMRIKAKMLAGFGVVLIILVAISVAAIWSFWTTKGEVETYSQRVKVADLADRLDRDVGTLRRFAREYALTGQDEDAVQAKETAASVRDQIAAALTEIRDPARHQRIQDLSRRFEKYSSNFERVHTQGKELNQLVHKELDPAGEAFMTGVASARDMAAKAGNGAVAPLVEAGGCPGRC